MTTVYHREDAPTLYTAEEAAEILRVKKSWLERQAAARKIPFTMLGRSYRFTAAHLAAIVRMHEQAPVPSAWPGDRDIDPVALQNDAHPAEDRRPCDPGRAAARAGQLD